MEHRIHTRWRFWQRWSGDVSEGRRKTICLRTRRSDSRVFAVRALSLNEAPCNETRKYLKCYEVDLDASHLHVLTSSIHLHKRNLYHPILLAFIANHRRHGNMLTTLLTKKPVVPGPRQSDLQDQLYFTETSLDGTNRPNSTKWAPSFARSIPGSWARHELILDPITMLNFSNETTWSGKPTWTLAKDQE